MKLGNFDTCFEKPVLHALPRTAEMSFVLNTKLFGVRTLRPLVPWFLYQTSFACIESSCSYYMKLFCRTVGKTFCANNAGKTMGRNRQITTKCCFIISFLSPLIS